MEIMLLTMRQRNNSGLGNPQSQKAQLQMFDTHIFSFEHSEMYKNSILRTPSSSCSLQLLVKYCQTLTSINELNKPTTFLVSNGDHNYDENDDLF